MSESVRDALYCPACEVEVECCKAYSGECRYPAGYPTCTKCEARPLVAGAMVPFADARAKAPVVPPPYPCIVTVEALTR